MEDPIMAVAKSNLERLSADPKTIAQARAREENLIALGHWAATEREEGREEGRQEGREEGRAAEAERFLRKLLLRRFDSLPQGIGAKISQANIEQLELWGERLLTSQSLEEVFANA